MQVVRLGGHLLYPQGLLACLRCFCHIAQTSLELGMWLGWVSSSNAGIMGLSHHSFSYGFNNKFECPMWWLMHVTQRQKS